MPTITTEAEALDALKELRQALAMAATLNEVVQVRRQAQRVQRLIQSTRLGMALQTQAVRIQLRAQRQAGLLLRHLVRHGGDRKSSDHADRWTRASLGVTSRQSAEWQRVGRLPGTNSSRTCADFGEGELLSSAGLVRWAKMCEEASKVPGEFESELLGRVPEQLQGLVRQGQRFACIYVNPPWRLAASRPTAIRGFAKALARLPVAAVAAQSAPPRAGYERVAGRESRTDPWLGIPLESAVHADGRRVDGGRSLAGVARRVVVGGLRACSAWRWRLVPSQ